MTPFEAWTGEKPNVDILRTFGCTAYANVAKDERKKLDSKARRCVFLRYGSRTKGYHFYDTSRSKVIHSRDVSFDESTRGFEIEKESVKDEEPQVVPLGGMEQTIDDAV